VENGGADGIGQWTPKEPMDNWWMDACMHSHVTLVRSKLLAVFCGRL